MVGDGKLVSIASVRKWFSALAHILVRFQLLLFTYALVNIPGFTLISIHVKSRQVILSPCLLFYCTIEF